MWHSHVIVDLKKKSIAPIVSNLAGRGEFITLRFDKRRRLAKPYIVQYSTVQYSTVPATVQAPLSCRASSNQIKSNRQIAKIFCPSILHLHEASKQLRLTKFRGTAHPS
jgi:hypothetical protein